MRAPPDKREELLSDLIKALPNECGRTGGMKKWIGVGKAIWGACGGEPWGSASGPGGARNGEVTLPDGIKDRPRQSRRERGGVGRVQKGRHERDRLPRSLGARHWLARGSGRRRRNRGGETRGERPRRPGAEPRPRKGRSADRFVAHPKDPATGLSPGPRHLHDFALVRVRRDWSRQDPTDRRHGGRNGQGRGALRMGSEATGARHVSRRRNARRDVQGADGACRQPVRRGASRSMATTATISATGKCRRSIPRKAKSG